MDYANNVSEDADFKMSKIRDEAFLPRWLTTLVNDEVVKGMLLPDPAAQLVSNLNEKGIDVKTLDDLQNLKGEAFDRFREADMPNTWIAFNPHIKGFKNDFIVPQRFWNFENSYAARIQKRFAEPASLVELVEEKKPNRPRMKM